MHNFSSLLMITLHVSDGLSVHHQESQTVHTASGMCQFQFHLVPASMLSTNLYAIYLTLYVQSRTPDDGRKDRPKHVE